jgi:iron complex outermembrane receptor protein
LSTYNREDFDTLGSATVDSLARYMLENFSGADPFATLNTNGDVGSLQQGAATNIFGCAAFDLLGLGPGVTLTLLDGHRIAPGGLDGSIVNVPLIPLSAIDRIEVLTGGASAIYGSDAVAGVVNIVTRRVLEGAETSFRYGRSTEGGAAQFTGAQLLGHAWSSGNVLLDYEYDDRCSHFSGPSISTRRHRPWTGGSQRNHRQPTRECGNDCRTGRSGGRSIHI